VRAASAVAATALAAAAVLTPVAVRSCHEAAAAATAAVVTKSGEALQSVFGSKVSITSAGVVCAPNGIAELAVTQQEVVVDTRRDRPWMFNWFTASLEIRGQYTAKAGIDLSRLAGWLDADRRVLSLRVPRCRLLSLETLGVDRKWQSDWCVNRCTPADFSAALTENISTARRQASRGEVMAQADGVLVARLRDALAPLGVRVQVSVADGMP